MATETSASGRTVTHVEWETNRDDELDGSVTVTITRDGRVTHAINLNRELELNKEE